MMVGKKQVSKVVRSGWMVLLICFIGFISEGSVRAEEILSQELLASRKLKINNIVQNGMIRGKIPGVSVVVVQGDKVVYQESFGYADTQAAKKVTSKTLFEIGSTSKAFTALGLLVLESSGRVNLNDPVDKYLPWFHMKHRGAIVPITLSNLLYQTSGIVFESIGQIPAADDPGALERTVRTLVGKELEFIPGERFSYATINYDVIGLVIQTVSGKSYEDFMRESVLNPLGLSQTYVGRKQIGAQELAVGYKIEYHRVQRYDAPDYRGNTPAGYIILNVEDLGKWIKVQLGTSVSPGIAPELITRTQTLNPNLPKARYAMGWMVGPFPGTICHEGSNPNYSSFILLNPQEKFGVGILANLSSGFTQNIAVEIYSNLKGIPNTEPPVGDIGQRIDNLSVFLLYICVPLFVSGVLLIVIFFARYRKNNRSFNGKRIGRVIGLILSSIVIALFGYALYHLPALLYAPLPWSFIRVWMPDSFPMAILTLFLTFFTYFIYLQLRIFCPKVKVKRTETES